MTHSNVVTELSEPGDHWLFLANGAPSQVAFVNTPAKFGLDLNFGSLYAQDSWTIKNRLTLNLGARFDHAFAGVRDAPAGGGQFANTRLAAAFPILKSQTIPGVDLLSWNNVAPRLAASWLLDSRTSARASFSRIYQRRSNFGLPGTGTAGITTLTFQWNDLNGDREYQVGEEGRLLSRIGGLVDRPGGGAPVDPDIRQTYSDEVVVGVSREVATDFSLNVNFIRRHDDNLHATIEAGIPFSTYTPVSVLDPGDDGLAGTGDDRNLTVYTQDPATFGRDIGVLANVPGNDRTFEGLEVVANKRLSHKWQFVTSLVVSKMDVTQVANDVGQVSQFRNPNQLVNAHGKDPGVQTYQLKVQASYFAPLGIGLSGFYRFLSGTPYTRQLAVRGLPQGVVTVFAEPRGSRETDNLSQLDFRAEKTLKLNGGLRLGLMLDVFNLTNSSAVTSYGSRTGVDLGKPLAVIKPRIARLGVRFTW